MTLNSGRTHLTRGLRKKLFLHRIWRPASVRIPPFGVSNKPISPAVGSGGGGDCVLRLGCLNIRSLVKKYHSLSDLIINKNIDVLSTTETWHDEGSLALTKLRQCGYLVLDRPRPREGFALRSLGTNHGGLAVIASSTVGLHQLNDGFSPNTFESLTAQINRGSRHINLLTVYRTGNLQPQFFSEFSDLLGRLVTKSPTLFVTGDFNIHLEKPDDRNCLAFRDLISSFGLRLVVEGATHDCGGLLDIVLKRDDKNKPITVVDKLETGLSDHQLLLWKISSPPSRHLTDASKVRQWRKLDIAGLERCLLSSPLVDSVAWPSMDVDQMVELYESTLTAALSTSLPVMAPRLYKYRHPWFDAECMRERCRLTSLRRRNAAREDIRAVARSYTRLLHTKRRHYYTKRIAEVHHPARRWKLVSEATGLGGVTGRSAAPTAETYSAFLNEKLNDICESTEGAPSPKFMSSTSISEFVQFCPASFDEVQRLISSLPGKQCGLDPIPTWLLKRLSHLLLPYLVHLFNKSLSSGQFPRSFKEAQVRPILKKSTLDPQLPSSYRPISNLSVLSKLLERLVLSRLLTHLNNNALLPKTQSAYRPHHSTETAVLRVVSDIRVALDVGHVSLLLLLDMSAAFDTVDHDILIARLDKTFAVRQTPLQWFRTYLSGRSQTILSSSSCSAKQLIQSGVPQGSVLGPILFSLYVSDIAGIVAAHGLSSHQYADDTQIYGHCRPEGVPDLVCRVSTCFRDIVSWTSSNQTVNTIFILMQR